MNERKNEIRHPLWKKLSTGAAVLMSAAVLHPGVGWAGDHDGDGYDELVIGAPGGAPGAGQARSGAAYVFRGATGGPTAEQRIDHTLFTMGMEGDSFGEAFAVGDFDGNGYQDLAVGIPGKQVDISVGAGLVMIFDGSPSGLVPRGFLWQSGAGFNEPGDRFGTSLAAGDFDGDGYDDLAAGAPGKSLSPGSRSGVVVLFRGTPSGLVPVRSVDQTGMGGNSDGDLFGATLTAGDYNGDGYVDLIVGAPGESIGGGPKSGVVFYFQGSASGLVADRYLDQAGMGTNDHGDEFGRALTSGDFDGDGYDDLVVGAPGEAIGGGPRSGVVFLFRGSASGLAADRYLDQGSMGGNSTGDRFGRALSTGDYDGDGIDDLAVGAPGEAIGGGPRSGAVFLFRGTTSGLTDLYYLRQDELDADEEGDKFGRSLTSGDYDGDGYDDLAVGAPWETLDTGEKSGLVFVFRGTASGPVAHDLLDQTGLGTNEDGDSFGEAFAGR